MSELIGQDRAQSIAGSAYYALQGNGYGPDGDTFRETFEHAVTDGIWRCANRYVARQWAALRGNVWVGEWYRGVSYADNTAGYCQKSGVVCHEVSLSPVPGRNDLEACHVDGQDDIYPTFQNSTASSELALESTVLDAWVNFIYNQDPNTSSQHRRWPRWLWSWCWWKRDAAQWQPYGTSTAQSTDGDDDTAQIKSIGGAEVGACPPAGFWGSAVKFDWQLYG